MYDNCVHCSLCCAVSGYCVCSVLRCLCWGCSVSGLCPDIVLSCAAYCFVCVFLFLCSVMYRILCLYCVRNIRILYILYSCACAYLCRCMIVCVYLVILYCVRMYVVFGWGCLATQSDTPHVGCLCGHRVRIIKAKKTQP